MIDCVSKIVGVSLSLCESIASQLQSSIQEVFEIVFGFECEVWKN